METQYISFSQALENFRQWKVGITEAGWIELNRFLELVNKDAKRKVRVPDILEHAVLKLDVSDVLKIQESVYTADDKIDIAWQAYNVQNSDKNVTRESFLNMMLETHYNAKRKPMKKGQIELNEQAS